MQRVMLLRTDVDLQAKGPAPSLELALLVVASQGGLSGAVQFLSVPLGAGSSHRESCLLNIHRSVCLDGLADVPGPYRAACPPPNLARPALCYAPLDEPTQNQRAEAAHLRGQASWKA